MVKIVLFQVIVTLGALAIFFGVGLTTDNFVSASLVTIMAVAGASLGLCLLGLAVGTDDASFSFISLITACAAACGAFPAIAEKGNVLTAVVIFGFSFTFVIKIVRISGFDIAERVGISYKVLAGFCAGQFLVTMVLMMATGMAKI